MHVVTLTTDFGVKDWFVGTMKGVILSLHPRARIVDLTHEIPGGDLRAGAFALAAGYHYFPKATVHIAVVDPGVGSARKAIAVQTANYFFVGPDNGVLSWALAREKIKSIRRLENEEYFLRPVSHTFHGRDVFAPVAAHLSRGVRIEKFGPPSKELVRLPWPEPRRQRGRIEGEVIYVDRFGNAITNIDNASLPATGRCVVFTGRRRLCSTGAFYRSAPLGHAVAVPGSAGYLEVCVNGGSAVKTLGLRIGVPVSVRLH